MKKELLDKHISDFNSNGFTIIENLFDKKQIESLNNYFLKQNNFESNNFDSIKVSDKRHQISVKFEAEFNNPELYANETVISILNNLLDENYLIESITCVVSLPGAKKMHIHRDGLIFPKLPISKLLPPHAIGLLIPLIPFTKETGPTKFWPKSHRSSIGREEAEILPFLAPELELGSAIMMDYRLLHGGSPNLSNVIRSLFYINYSNNWYIDNNNFDGQPFYTMSEEEFSKVNSENRHLFKRRNIYL